MKKLYFAILSIAFVSASASAQVNDTIYSHIAGTLAYYTWNGGNGYATGNNSYGDKAIVQLFDNTHGVTLGGAGTINGVLLFVASKDNAGGTYTVNIWSDNAGAPGTVLGSKIVTLAATDTSLAATTLLGGMTAYNVNANFTVPIAIPTSGKFWAGVTLPTTAAAGDTLVLWGNSDNDFGDATTHSGVIDNTNAFVSFNAAGIDIASAIFPYVTYTSFVGVEENSVVSSVYPNPTNGLVNFTFANGETNYIIVRDISGRTVAKIDVNSSLKVATDFSELENGTYVYETINFDGVATSIAKFIKQ